MPRFLKRHTQVYMNFGTASHKRTNLPSTANKLFPKNGNPGRLASTIIRKSGCITILVGEGAAPEVAGTILRPSDKIISPDSISVCNYKHRRLYTSTASQYLGWQILNFGPFLHIFTWVKRIMIFLNGF